MLDLGMITNLILENQSMSSANHEIGVRRIMFMGAYGSPVVTF